MLIDWDLWIGALQSRRWWLWCATVVMVWLHSFGLIHHLIFLGEFVSRKLHNRFLSAVLFPVWILLTSHLVQDYVGKEKMYGS